MCTDPIRHLWLFLFIKKKKYQEKKKLKIWNRLRNLLYICIYIWAAKKYKSIDIHKRLYNNPYSVDLSLSLPQNVKTGIYPVF